MFDKFYDNMDSEHVWRRNVLALAKALIVDICDDFISSSSAITEDCLHVFNLLQVFEHIFGRKLREPSEMNGSIRNSRGIGSVFTASSSFLSLSSLTNNTHERFDPWTIVEMCSVSSAQSAVSQTYDKTTEIVGEKASRIEKFRTWFLLTLEEKKLEDSFNEIIGSQANISNVYNDGAFLCSDEAAVLLGFLPSLRCVDFAICLRGAKLDYPFIALDFSPYLSTRSLRRAITNQRADDQEGPDVSSSHLAALLDQKAYLEEMNARLTERNKVLEAQVVSETSSVRDSLEHELETAKAIHSLTKKSLEDQLSQVESQLRDAESARLLVEREKAAETSARKERELSAEVLERDLQLKQELIASLREQIADLKSRLARTSEVEQNLITAEQARAVLAVEVESRDRRIADGENNIRIEREWRMQLQRTLESERMRVATLQAEFDQLRARCQEAEHRCAEQETALADMAQRLAESRLRIDHLEEANASKREAQWVDDKDTVACTSCSVNFSVSRRRHHCRSCGGVFCDDCSSKRIQLPSAPKPVRVCDSCFTRQQSLPA